MAYTKEQQKALEKTFKPGLRLNAARASYANKVLLPNGRSASLAALRKAMKAAGRSEELERHIEEKRFFFVVLDWPKIPKDPTKGIVYFQCAVPGNPDVEEA